MGSSSYSSTTANSLDPVVQDNQNPLVFTGTGSNQALAAEMQGAVNSSINKSFNVGGDYTVTDNGAVSGAIDLSKYGLDKAASLVGATLASGNSAVGAIQKNVADVLQVTKDLNSASLAAYKDAAFGLSVGNSAALGAFDKANQSVSAAWSKAFDGLANQQVQNQSFLNDVTQKLSSGISSAQGAIVGLANPSKAVASESIQQNTAIYWLAAAVGLAVFLKFKG